MRTHCDPQQVSPGPQLPEPPQRHRPSTQVSPALQERPQAPQFAASFIKLRQPTPSQQVSAVPHSCPLQVQLPFRQVRPGAHTRPQAPQLSLLVETFTQVVLPQQISGVTHELAPQAQLFPAEQPIAPPQQSPPGPQSPPPILPSHSHAPVLQVSPGLQTRVQLPQWKGSLVVSMQPISGQQLLPGAQAELVPH